MDMNRHGASKILTSIESEILNVNRAFKSLRGQSAPHLFPSNLEHIQRELIDIQHQIKHKPRTTQNTSTRPPTAPINRFKISQQVRKPYKQIITDQRARKTIQNPKSPYSVLWVKNRYKISHSNSSSVRPIGSRSFKRPKIPRSMNTKILPHSFRNDPTCEPPPITQKDVSEGVFSLITRGLIPKDVDLTPAFEHGNPPLQLKTAELHDWRDRAPPLPQIHQMQITYYEQKEEFPDTVPSIMAIDNLDPSLVSQQSCAQTYEQVMDQFSAHRIFIRRGVVLDSPEFQSFKRVNLQNWGSIQSALQSAEEIFGSHCVKNAIINGSKLAEIVSGELGGIKKNQILECLLNDEQVKKEMTAPGSKEVAAGKIQACWRGHKSYMAYENLKLLIKKARMIQRAFRRYIKRIKLS